MVGVGPGKDQPKLQDGVRGTWHADPNFNQA